MLAISIDLCEDGPKAPWLFVIAQAGVDDEGKGPVASQIVKYLLGAEVAL